MKAIYKYGPLSRSIRNEIPMPSGARVVKAGWQRDPESSSGFGVFIWATVDTEMPDVVRAFYVIGTGWDHEDRWQHIDTTVGNDGFAWHVMEDMS